jgi:hypothetical protein
MQDEGLFHLRRDELRMRNKLFLLAVWERLTCRSLDSLLHHIEQHPCSLLLLYLAARCDEHIVSSGAFYWVDWLIGNPSKPGGYYMYHEV